ncbi:hypothetical protein, partial [Chlorobaculum thiosulfatiphilum]|uniref:hypothetical protein n=1 Tax=Chlorobaculum thiosulfatiphilum TaxID=115852 RepID=UPI0014771E66
LQGNIALFRCRWSEEYFKSLFLEMPNKYPEASKTACPDGRNGLNGRCVPGGRRGQAAEIRTGFFAFGMAPAEHAGATLPVTTTIRFALHSAFIIHHS